MRVRIFSVVLALIISVGILGCTSTKRAQQGAGIGALTGGLTGALLAGDKGMGALIGAGIGGILGYIIGNEMDKSDMNRLNDTYETTPSYQTTEWRNPDTGTSYAVTPKPAYKENQYLCRDAEINAVIDGKPEVVNAKACRNSDGNWVLVEN
jgi:surface antigen